MNEAERKARNAEYSRRWRALNPERARAISVRHRTKPETKALTSARQKIARAADPVRYRGYTLSRYGLTVATWEALFDAQGRACAICRSINASTWHTDHDAAIGLHAVRGILCQRCNMGVGLFDDNPAALSRAALYLERR